MHDGKKARVIQALNRNPALCKRAAREIAEIYEVSEETVYEAKREWRRQEDVDKRMQRRCSRCTIFGDQENPVGEDGLCLWCRLEMNEVIVREFFEDGGAVVLGLR